MSTESSLKWKVSVCHNYNPQPILGIKRKKTNKNCRVVLLLWHIVGQGLLRHLVSYTETWLWPNVAAYTALVRLHLEYAVLFGIYITKHILIGLTRFRELLLAGPVIRVTLTFFYKIHNNLVNIDKDMYLSEASRGNGSTWDHRFQYHRPNAYTDELKFSLFFPGQVQLGMDLQPKLSLLTGLSPRYTSSI